MSYGKGVGFSSKIKRPEFQNIKKKVKPTFSGVLLPLAIISIIIFVILGIFSVFKWSTSLICGGTLGLIFVLLYFFLPRKNIESTHQDGTLVKKSVLKKKDAKTKNEVIFLLKFAMENGSEKKLNVSQHKSLYNYYKEDDLVRFHPFFPYPEKYEKLFDDKIVCISCGKLTTSEEDKCKNCKLPLLK